MSNQTDEDGFIEVIQLALSIQPRILQNEAIFEYPLEKIIVDHNACDSNGVIKVYIGNITMPALPFCGEMYLFVILHSLSHLTKVRISISSKRLHALCNKPNNLKIVLHSNTVDDKIIINVNHSDYVYGSNKLKLKLPHTAVFTLSNLDDQALQARCGVYALQVGAFIVPSKRNRSLDYVQLNDRLVFNALQCVSHKYYNLLMTDKECICSPQIAQYSDVELQINYFEVNEDDLEDLQLVFIIDPLNLSNFSSSIASRTFAFNTTIVCDMCKCLSHCQVFTSLDRAIIRHYINLSHQEFFDYNIETRRLHHLPYDDRVVQDVNTYFYTQWIIHLTSMLLICRDEFDLKQLPHVALYSLEELIVEVDFLLTNTSAKSTVERLLKDKLVFIFNALKQTFLQVLQGNLNIYFSQFLKLSLNIMNDNTTYFDINQNWWNTFKKTLENVVSSDAPSTPLSKVIPKRIRQFIQRVYFDSEETMYVYDYYKWTERVYLTALKIALNMVVDEAVWTEEIPLKWVILINKMLMSSSQEELHEHMSELKPLLEDFKHQSELNYLAYVMLRSFKSTFWEKWIELKKCWQKVVSDQLDVYRYGIPKAIYFSYLADDAALQYLLDNQVFPSFLFQQEKMTKKAEFIYFSTDKGIVTRGEYDGISGSVYFTKIMICHSTNNTLISNCTIKKID